MNVTDVRVRRVRVNGKLKAVASITIDNSMAIHDIKIIEGQNGLFIAMPSRKTPSGEYRDIAHPINQDTRGYLQELIINAYNDLDDEVEEHIEKNV